MRGFTLIELLITMSIFGVIVASGMSILANTYGDYLFSSERDQFVATLRSARNQALNNVHAAAHGVYVASSSLTIFEGASYATRVFELDEDIPRSSNVTIGGSTEVVFQPLSARTDATIFTLSYGLKAASISLNTEGVISW